MKRKQKNQKPKLYIVDDDYIAYLFSYDDKIMYNKSGRPYIGIVYNVNDFYYFAPLTSLKGKKEKKQTIPKDGLLFQSLENGKYGGIHIGNMIPVPQACLRYYDFDKARSTNAKDALRNEYRAILKVWPKIQESARKVYKIRCKQLSELTSTERIIRARCCNFKLLEQKCKEYEKSVLQENAADSSALSHTEG